MDPKKVYESPDVQPVALYAKDTADSIHAYPLLRGALGFNIPAYDSLLITSSSGNPTNVHYISSGSTVATLLVTYSSGTPTHVYLT